MNFKTKHIGSYSNNGAASSIIELIVVTDNAEISETITNFSDSKVDVVFIDSLRELADELEQQNNRIEECSK